MGNRQDTRTNLEEEEEEERTRIQALVQTGDSPTQEELQQEEEEEEWSDSLLTTKWQTQATSLATPNTQPCNNNHHNSQTTTTTVVNSKGRAVQANTQEVLEDSREVSSLSEPDSTHVAQCLTRRAREVKGRQASTSMRSDSHLRKK